VPVAMELQSIQLTGPGDRSVIETLTSNGIPVARQDRYQSTEKTLLDERGLPRAYQDRLGNVWRYEYDDAYQLVRTIDPAGGTTERVFERGRIVGRQDPAGRRWHYGYDDLDRPSALADPLGRSVTVAWNDANLVAAVTDVDGAVTSYEYDPHGDVGRTVLPGGEVAHTYDAVGRAVQRTHSDGSTARYEYDALGRLTALSAEGPQDAGSVQCGYDAVGALVALLPGDGVPVTIDYDAKQRVTAITRGDASVTLEYDEAGNCTRWRDGRGNELSFGYDLADRLNSIASAGQVRTLTLDRNGNPRSVADAGGAAGLATFTYDFRNQITGAARPDGRRLSVDYDAGGVLQRTTDERRRVTSYPDAFRQGFAAVLDPLAGWVEVLPQLPRAALPERAPQIQVNGLAAAEPFLRVVDSLTRPAGLGLVAAQGRRDALAVLERLGYTVTFERRLVAQLRQLADAMGGVLPLAASTVFSRLEDQSERGATGAALVDEADYT